MASVIVKKVLDRTGESNIFRLLCEELSGTELNSLLLEVFNERISQQSPAQLLKHYQLNRFVKPTDLPMLELKQIELDLLKIFQKCLFEPIELSPVAALGTCSIVAPADQKKILSALRGTEVLADATNAIALHISDLKKQKLWAPKNRLEKLRLATIQRHVRTQSISGRGFTPHFKIGCLVTSGLDTGNFGFEKEALTEHILAMKAIFREYYKVDQLSFRLVCRGGYPDSVKLAAEVKKFIQQHYPDTSVQVVGTPEKETGYYKGIQYKVDIKWGDKTFEIGDGGFVDWTQQLLQNKKERLLITGFGFELMYRITHGML
jgi:hypothetical protein